MWQEFISPSSVEEALEILEMNKGRARLIAGGTDLVIQLKKGEKEADCLVSINEIQSLKGIRYEQGIIYIGAAVSHAEVARNNLIVNNVPALSEACSVIGSPQIRNVGTVVGNIVNAAPAADSAVVLSALDAELEVLAKSGKRVLAIEDAYEGLLKSAIDSTREIVTGVNFILPSQNTGVSFVRVSARKSLALPILNSAFLISIENEKIVSARAVFSPVGPKPLRVRELEKVLVGNRLTDEIVMEAATLASELVEPRDSIRGSKKVRKAMTKDLVIKGIEAASRRICSQKGEDALC